MKRDSAKLCTLTDYEATAGGSALFGEIAEQAILREVREETGIELTADQLRHHTHFIAHDDQVYLPQLLGRNQLGRKLLSNSKPTKPAIYSGSTGRFKRLFETELVIPRQKVYVERLFLEQEWARARMKLSTT